VPIGNQWKSTNKHHSGSSSGSGYGHLALKPAQCGDSDDEDMYSKPIEEIRTSMDSPSKLKKVVTTPPPIPSRTSRKTSFAARFNSFQPSEYITMPPNRLRELKEKPEANIPPLPPKPTAPTEVANCRKPVPATPPPIPVKREINFEEPPTEPPPIPPRPVKDESQISENDGTYMNKNEVLAEAREYENKMNSLESPSFGQQLQNTDSNALNARNNNPLVKRSCSSSGSPRRSYKEFYNLPGKKPLSNSSSNDSMNAPKSLGVVQNLNDSRKDKSPERPKSSTS